MFSETFLLILLGAAAFLSGIFLAWVIWLFHIRPNYFRRRGDSPHTLRPGLRFSSSDL